MSVKIREKNNYLYLDIYSNGIRKWERLALQLTGDSQTDREKLRLAEQIRLRKEIQLFTGEHGLIDTLTAKKTLYSYILELVKIKGKKTSLYKVSKYLEDYPEGQTIQIKQINGVWVELFQNFLLTETELSNNSISQYIKAIRTVLNKAVKDNIILKNPIQHIKIVKIPDKIHDVLTINEIQILQDTEINSELGKEIKKAFIFACFCGGLRISDLKSLKWENIEHRDNKIYLAKVQEKTKKIVRHELNRTAFELINDDKIHNRDQLIFPLLSKRKPNSYRYLTQWALKAGIEKNIGWHTARRSNATLLIEAGTHINIVQKILGHNNIATTQKYIQVTDTAINAAANALPEIKIKKMG